jgi:hypothetical protein
MTQATTKDRILASLRNSKAKVFLRDDFDLSWDFQTKRF